jgi:Fe-S-cluster-containing hydrogenase component 2
VACTGCEKCVDVCRYDSVVVENNLAIIDPEKCKLCKDCVEVCPSKVIDMVNFPPKKDRPPRKDRPDRKLARKKTETVGAEAGGAEAGGVATAVERGNKEAAGTDTAELKDANNPISESKTSNIEGQPSDKTEPNPVARNTEKPESGQPDKKDNSSEKENKA